MEKKEFTHDVNILKGGQWSPRLVWETSVPLGTGIDMRRLTYA